jgi:adenosylmethionine-8-amino-7-oxononanoate aminotransferase
MWGVNADIWCLAKGLSSGYIPLGATAIGQGIVDTFLKAPAGIGAIAHGYTYSAHPVAAAAALESLRLVQELDLAGNAARVGGHMQARLASFVSRYPHVGDVRGVGLMACVEMVESKVGKTPLARGSALLTQVARAAYRRGAMVRVSGPNIILSPPLIITREQVDVLVDALDGALAEVESAL